MEESWLEKDQAHDDRPEGQGQVPYYSRGRVMKNFILFVSVVTFNRVSYEIAMCMEFSRAGAVNG